MRIYYLLNVAAGLMLGLVLSPSKPAYLLIFAGFWMGAMWGAWIPGIVVAWMLGRARVAKILVPFSLASAGSFSAAFPMVGLEDGEGSPGTATVVGAWMVFWLAVAVRGIGELIRLRGHGNGAAQEVL